MRRIAGDAEQGSHQAQRQEALRGRWPRGQGEGGGHSKYTVRGWGLAHIGSLKEIYHPALRSSTRVDAGCCAERCRGRGSFAPPSS